MNKESLKISGMTCAACAQRIEKAVNKLEGVSNASVNFATEKLSVEFDGQKLLKERIRETIEKTGYGIIEEAQKRTVTIPIGATVRRTIWTRTGPPAGKPLKGVAFAIKGARDMPLRAVLPR
jgi:Cu+-exporting ATPase